MKPEWCPQWAWDQSDYLRQSTRETIARTLLDAHQRGRREGMEENQRLRQIISECATAAGAFVSPAATVEFMALLPKEIEAIGAKMEEKP